MGDEKRIPVDTMTFDKDFATGQVVGKHFGRLYFAHGVVRLYLLPDGLHAIVPKAVADKDFYVIENTPYEGLGPLGSVGVTND